jgi:hypothetical protein
MPDYSKRAKQIADLKKVRDIKLTKRRGKKGK